MDYTCFDPFTFGVVCCDGSLRIRYVNPEGLAMSGFTAQQVTGLPLLELVSQSDSERVSAELRTLRLVGKGRFVFSLRNTSGNQIEAIAGMLRDTEPGYLFFLYSIDTLSPIATPAFSEQVSAIARERRFGSSAIAAALLHTVNTRIGIAEGRLILLREAKGDIAEAEIALGQIQLIKAALDRISTWVRRDSDLSPRLIDFSMYITDTLALYQQFHPHYSNISFDWVPPMESVAIRCVPGDPAQVLDIMFRYLLEPATQPETITARLRLFAHGSEAILQLSVPEQDPTQTYSNKPWLELAASLATAMRGSLQVTSQPGSRSLELRLPLAG